MRKFLFGALLFCFSLGWAAENECHVFLVQIETVNESELSRSLTAEEEVQAEDLAEQFASLELSAIYSSDRPLAMQTAQILAQYHDCPLIIHPALRDFTISSLFYRIGDLKDLGERIYYDHRDENIICITHESLINFAGRYVQGGFKGISHFSYVQLEFDGSGIHLP